MLRYLRYIKLKAKGSCSKEYVEKLPGAISVEELRTAENRLLSYEQRRKFAGVFAALERKESLTSKHCPKVIKRLDPFVQEGILRIRGRTCNAPVEYNAKHPAILPVESRLSRLIIRSHHDLVGHAGLGHTFTALKERFWVLKGSTSIRQVIADCFVCRRINATPAV